MSKFYQHINPTDSNFDQITELDYIDDLDPGFILYHFKDGTKCNEAYIGKINDATAFDRQMELAEISGPQNKWQFGIDIIEAKQTYAKDVNGEEVLINDPYVGQRKPKEKIVVKSAPYRATPLNEHVRRLSQEATPAPEINTAYNFDEAPVKVTQTPPPTVPNAAVVQTAEFEPFVRHNQGPESVYLDLDNKKLEITVKYNGTIEKYSVGDMIGKLFKMAQVAQTITVQDSKLALEATEEQIKLLDSMLSMSKKEECDISLDVTMTIPPKSFYEMIDTNYQEGLSTEFLKLIANKLNSNDLRQLLLNGLQAYYNGDIEVEEVKAPVAAPVAKPKRASKKSK